VTAKRPPRRPPERAAGRTRQLVIGAAGLVGIVVLVLIVATSRSDQPGRPGTPPSGVRVYPGLARDHVTGAVRYPQTPPVGGAHAPVWQNCGIYSSPVPNQTAVHSMEHGAVWLTYRPDLPKKQIRKLEALARGHPYVLVSPYPRLPHTIVASAWGRQLAVDDAGDPRLERFIEAFEQGPQSPEPGAPCRGGVGTPGR
jgi:hypothetical protein